jgi:hypothetical protein
MSADLDSRAKEVTIAVGAMKQPAMPVSLRVWAMRRNWTFADLDAAIARACELGKLTMAPKGLSMPTVAAEPVAETEPEPEPAPTVGSYQHTQVELPAGAGTEPFTLPATRTMLDCLCARTASKVNYGCPEHGGARITTSKENIEMAKEWISSAEAAQLAGCSVSNVLELAKKDKFGSRAPLEFLRSSVVAYRDAKRKEASARDLMPATPTKRKALVPKKSKALVPAAAAPTAVVEATLVEPHPAALADVRALVRFVDKGWFSKDDAWAKLRELVA